MECGALRRCSISTTQGLARLALIICRLAVAALAAGRLMWRKPLGDEALPPNGRLAIWPLEDSYLVDPASSHMLVSKIKPCMSKYKQLYGETANGSLNQLSFI